jgi:hypothetical protein
VSDQPYVITATVDPRLIEAVVDFTTEVAEVAGTLTNLGMSDEAGRLIGALNRLDAAGAD